jgi:hypothetical protein
MGFRSMLNEVLEIEKVAKLLVIVGMLLMVILLGLTVLFVPNLWEKFFGDAMLFWLASFLF